MSASTPYWSSWSSVTSAIRTRISTWGRYWSSSAIIARIAATSWGSAWITRVFVDSSAWASSETGDAAAFAGSWGSAGIWGPGVDVVVAAAVGPAGSGGIAGEKPDTAWMVPRLPVARIASSTDFA